MFFDVGGPDSGAFSSDVDVLSTVAEFPFALVIGLGFGIDVGIVVDSSIVNINSLLVICDSPVELTSAAFAFPLPVGRGFGRNLAKEVGIP